jgi:hypothetical protein
MVFRCPKCKGEIHAHCKGEDVEVEAPDLTPAPWVALSR